MNAAEIHMARNRTKRQKQIYVYEAMFNMAALHAEKIMGKKSFSLFACASVAIALKKLGCKMEFLTEEDRRNFNELYKCISS